MASPASSLSLRSAVAAGPAGECLDTLRIRDELMFIIIMVHVHVGSCWMVVYGRYYCVLELIGSL